MNRGAFLTLASLCLVSYDLLALDSAQIEHENALTRIATERCQSESIEGKDYKITALGDGKVEVQFIGKKGAELSGSFVYTKAAWEGRQQVLREHQAQVTMNFVKCKREELKSLRKSYTPPDSRPQDIQSKPTPTSAIVIKAPDIAENGCVIPVAVETQDISAREISIYSGSRSNLAMRTRFPDSSAVPFASTKIKMAGTGSVIAEVTDRDGKVFTSKKEVKITNGCNLTSGGDGSSPTMEVRGAGGTLKILATHGMYTNDYIESLDVSSNGRKIAEVSSTAWLSTNPYFSFQANNGSSVFSVRVVTTSGKSAERSTH